MSERRSTYVFDEEEDYEMVKEVLYDRMRSDYDDSDKLFFYGYWGGQYRVDIYSGCSNPEKAASYCREHGGRFVSNP